MEDKKRTETGLVVTNQNVSIVSVIADVWHYWTMIQCLWKGLNIDFMQPFVAGEQNLGDGYDLARTQCKSGCFN